MMCWQLAVYSQGRTYTDLDCGVHNAAPSGHMLQGRSVITCCVDALDQEAPGATAEEGKGATAPSTKPSSVHVGSSCDPAHSAESCCGSCSASAAVCLTPGSFTPSTPALHHVVHLACGAAGAHDSGVPFRH